MNPSPAQKESPPPLDERRLHVNFGIVSVGSVLKSAAYNLCGTIPDRLTDQTFDFSRKRAEHYGHFHLLPPSIQDTPYLADPGQFWAAAEGMERQANGQVARQLLLSIPRGIPRALHADYVSHVLRPYIEAGMAAHVDLHDPGARDGGEQAHAHVMLTMRQMNPDGTFSKKKERSWNALFRAGNGRVQRARIEARGNQYLLEHGYNIRIRVRSNADIDGPDALPPEPQLSRAVIEQSKRHPDNQPAEIIDLDNYRVLHRSARESRTARRAAEDGLRAARATTEKQAMAKRPQGQRPAWMTASGGYDALPPDLKQSAERSYDIWKTRRAANGQTNGDLHSLGDYVSYVQGQRRDDRGWRFERPDANANTVRRAPAPDAEILDSEAPAQKRARDQDDEDYPTEDGWTRETRFRARLLAGHYKISEAALTPAQLAAITRISIDKARGVATIELSTGDVYEDFGDRIVSPRDPSPETATEIAKAAQLHGWSSVALTGTPAYRDEVAIALGLLEPPVSHDWQLSPEAQARLEAALEARRLAVENTNAIRPVDVLENAIVPTEAPAPSEPEPEPEPETRFVLPEGNTATLSEMRSHPALAQVADRLATMSDEQLESYLRRSFPYYTSTGDDTAARTSAIAAWKAARKSAQENHHESNPHTDRSPSPSSDSRPHGVGAHGPSLGNGAHADQNSNDVDIERPGNTGTGNSSTDSRSPSVAAAPSAPVNVNDLRAFRRQQFDAFHDEAQAGYAHLITKGVPEFSPEFRATKARVDALRAAAFALDSRDPAALAALEKGDFQALLKAGDDYTLNQQIADIKAQQRAQAPKKQQPKAEQNAAPSPD